MGFTFERGRIYCGDSAGRIMAEIIYQEDEDGCLNITRTYVDESQRGKGLAGDLVQAVVSLGEQQHRKVRGTCSYAAKWLSEHGNLNE